MYDSYLLKNVLQFLESQKLDIFQENRVYCKLVILFTVIFFVYFSRCGQLCVRSFQSLIWCQHVLVHSWLIFDYLTFFERDYVQSWQLSIFIRHSTHYLFSDYQKRKVNFRNQRSRHHLAAGYTTIMSRSLKETVNRVMCDRGT